MAISNGCDDCGGACCKRVDLETREIIRCQYLTDEDLCSIYEDRPIACRLDPRFVPTNIAEAHCALSKMSIDMSLPLSAWYDK